MNNVELLETFYKKNAILKGHFLLSSGLHSDTYFQCALIFSEPKIGTYLSRALSEKLKHIEFDTVIGPAIGGILPSYEIANQLNKKGIFAERQDNIMQLKRGFTIEPGERVVISEDVLTTGKSTIEVIDLLETLKAKIEAIAVFVDRRTDKTKSIKNIPVYSLIEVTANTFDKENCPLCKKNIPVTKPGSRIFSTRP